MPITRCPGCKGGEFYEIDQMCFSATDSSNGTIDFQLYAHYGPSGESGWLGEKHRRLAIGASARVCKHCGHTTLFTKDLATLERFAAQGLVRTVTTAEAGSETDPAS